MAYQTRGRDPLFDSKTQAALERRGKELLGITLIGLGVACALMLGSYVPDDTGWMSASAEPARNLLGRLGASIASPLFVIVGYGAWGIAATLLVWGARFLIHNGEERAAGRIIFAPMGIALLSVYASTHVPGAGWTHSFGLGGLFGDTVLGAILGLVPLSAATGLKTMALVTAAAALTMGLFVFGFSSGDMRRFGRWLLRGVLLSYLAVMNLLGRGGHGLARGLATGAGGALRAGQSRREARRSARAQQSRHGDDDERLFDGASRSRREISRGRGAVPPAPEDDFDPFDTGDDGFHIEPARGDASGHPPKRRPGFLGRLLARRSASGSELSLDEPLEDDGEIDADDGSDRIKAKIADVIRARMRAAPILTAGAAGQRTEPPVARRHPRGPAPMILTKAQVPPLRADMPLGRTQDAPADPESAEIAARTMAAPRQDDVRQPGVQFAPRQAEHVGPLFGGAAEEDRDPADDLWEDGGAAREAMDMDVDAQGSDGSLPEPELVTPSAAPASPSFNSSRELSRTVVQKPVRKPVAPTVAPPAATADDTARMRDLERPEADYVSPPLELLTNPSTIERLHLSDEALEENARMLEAVLDDYGVKGEIVSVRPGPVVTMYELEPAPGLKASRVIGLADDIARSMSALSARVSTVPGRSVIGIELPNEKREMCVLREVLAAQDFGDSTMQLPLALGKDIGGDPVVANLAKMPHLLIAGTTGSGKSVAINTMILSLLYKLSPEECRLIMIDPKMLELSVYDGIPHLLSPVVTDPKKAVVALKWVVGEMEDRYRKMSKMGVRNIEGYNGRVREALAKDEMFSRTVQTGFDDETGEPVFETEQIKPEVLPFIVVIVDEMADLMMVAGKEIEACIQRLAQMARASGIHLIMATQRPSVDVITGTIKANFPTRISFQVTSKIDSRTILGEQGAEQLLGMGDMLYMAGGSKITRVHGPFCSDEEVEEIVTYLKQFGPPDYMSGVVEGPDDDKSSDIDAVLGLGGGEGATGDDALYDQAVAIAIKDRKCSTSYIQRKLAIGYNKAARLVEQMEDEGVVSSANHVGKREILVPEPQ
ncbi:DNA translocase FtsK [Profundibacterium mesophilum]|uniref:DNA translocase FtsK n=1 Tax=Profundibacterium mesophilum KAUST100406-0324 TaxID=1037889 RepID=A0A921NW22_9RHOB|nr:DNA translocase FtsK [Profundibacterium mesophilum]KAF0676540.1 DNA translocase FtsK [Profundibacterium mesophilum KAUST100406-0324]